jgi:hypothetical protein
MSAIDISNLGFEPVTFIRDLAETPRAGTAMFCGVPYDFRPSTFVPTWPPRGLLCDLKAIDPDEGLPMLAEGEFRKLAASNAGFEVRWTSLGSPGLPRAPGIRAMFASFLERLANGAATGAHWDAFLVEHYLDDLLEETRRACVGMLGGRDALSPLQSGEQAQLHSWAQALLAAGAV